MSRDVSLPGRYPTARSVRVATLLLLVFAGFWTAGWLFRPPGVLQGLDFYRYYEFNAEWIARSFAEGHIRWWNPHVGLGRPFFADLQTGVLYPPNWIFAVLAVPAGTTVLVWLHLSWAAAGVMLSSIKLGVRLPIAFCSALLFLLLPALVVRLVSGQVHYVAALSYLPGLFWLQLRVLENPTAARSAMLAAAMALQLLCGHPQVSWLSAVGLAFFTAGSSDNLRSLVPSVFRLFLCGLAALALTAPVLLPFFELVGQSNRTSDASLLSAYGAMNWRDWLALGAPVGDNFVPDIEAQVFVGLPVLALAAIAMVSHWRDRFVRGLAAMALGSAALASALPGWLHQICSFSLPGFAAFRLHSRTSVLVVFAAWLLAAWWLSRRSPTRWVTASAGVITALLLLFPLPGLKSRYVLARSYPAEADVKGLSRALMDDTDNGVPPRLNVSASLVRENSGMLTGHSTFGGYVSLFLARPWEYMHAAAQLPVPEELTTFPDVRIFQQDPFLYDSMNLVAGFDTRTRQMKLEESPDPRAYLCFRAEAVNDWRAAIGAMTGEHDFHRIALVESPAQVVSGVGSGSVAITGFARERVELRAQTDRRAVLVLAEAWYPGWNVSVNGKPAAAFPVNAWMRGVILPPGDSTVVWQFQPHWVGAGAAVSVATILLLAASIWHDARRRKRGVAR